MTIIEKIPIKEVPDSWTYIFATVIVIAYLLTICISYAKEFRHRGSIKKSINVIVIAGLIILSLAFSWACFSEILFAQPTGQYEYKALLDDNYPANTLYNNYKDITWDGTYYYFKDK